MSERDLRTELDAALFNKHGGGSVSSRWTVNSILEAILPIISSHQQAAFERGRQAGLEQASQHFPFFDDDSWSLCCSCGWSYHEQCNDREYKKLFQQHIRSLAQPAASGPLRNCHCGNPKEPHLESVHEAEWRASAGSREGQPLDTTPFVNSVADLLESITVTLSDQHRQFIAEYFEEAFAKARPKAHEAVLTAKR